MICSHTPFTLKLQWVLRQYWVTQSGKEERRWLLNIWQLWQFAAWQLVESDFDWCYGSVDLLPFCLDLFGLLATHICFSFNCCYGYVGLLPFCLDLFGLLATHICFSFNCCYGYVDLLTFCLHLFGLLATHICFSFNCCYGYVDLLPFCLHLFGLQ